MEDKNGKLKILNGKIRVIYVPPGEGGAPPQIMPTKGIKIFVNDLLIDAPTIINVSDDIRFETEEELLEKGKLDFKISSDGLSAWILLKPRLKARHLILHSEEEFLLKPTVQRELFKEPIAVLEEVKDLLPEKNINYGLNEEILEKAVREMTRKWVEIAQGTPPTPGENAHIEIFFEQKQIIPYQANDINNVDYLDKGHIPAIEKDALLAKKTPVILGKAGISVRGEEIPPPIPQDISLLAGPNTYRDKNGLQIFAAVLGRPILIKTPKSYKIQIHRTYVVNSDVNITTGHIRFQGDIQVHGKVLERMEVLAGGYVKISDRVTGADIRAAGSIAVSDNVINSHLIAGARQFFTMQVLPGLLAFKNTLITILKAFQQVKKTPPFENASFGHMLFLLTEKKFRHFPVQLKKLTKMLYVDLKEDFPPQTTIHISALRKKAKDFRHLQYQELEDAMELLEKINLVRKELMEIPQEENDITVRYCLNSKLEASGDVTITGSGSYHTDIISQKNITISGVIRGGTISAKKDIKINEAGSEAAILTTLIVPRKQKIYINKAFANTIVQIGKYTYKFSRERNKVKIFVRDEDEAIVIENF